MAGLSVSLQREAVVQAWVYFIRAATGSDPIVLRSSDRIDITWNEGQAEAMQQYLETSMSAKADKNGINVNLDLLPVIAPLAIKKSIGYVIGYTVLVMIATKILWKGKKHG